jgi:pantetheine-phosphate adenylyltransferase
MTIALYPGTFDPITNGHLDVVKRASALFDKVIVAVYAGSLKSVMFTTEERIALCQKAVDGIPNVEAVTFSGLVVSFAESINASVMLRGLRAGADFDHEFDMALMNKTLAPNIETVFLMANIEWQFLSSSRIKEVAELGADVSGLVTQDVVEALRAKLNNKA